MKKILARFRRNESGATAIEYGLIAAFVALVLVATLPTIKTNLNSTFTSIGSSLDGTP